MEENKNNIQFQLGEFAQFKKDVKEDLGIIKSDIRDLKAWKIKVGSFAGGVGAVIGVLIQLLFKYL